MKYISLIIILFIIIACDSERRNSYQSIQHEQDSIAQLKKDSAEKFYNKEQNKIIGDIEFGITEKQFKKLSEQFDAKNYDNELIKHKIGDYYYSTIQGYYYNNKLHEVDIMGSYIDYNDYNTVLINQVSLLKDIISKKYGPNSYGQGLIAGYSIEKDQSRLVYGWSVGTKDIHIRIANRGLYYSVDLEIFQPKIREIINKEFDKKKDSTSSKASEVL